MSCEESLHHTQCSYESNRLPELTYRLLLKNVIYKKRSSLGVSLRDQDLYGAYNQLFYVLVWQLEAAFASTRILSAQLFTSGGFAIPVRSKAPFSNIRIVHGFFDVR